MKIKKNPFKSFQSLIFFFTVKNPFKSFQSLILLGSDALNRIHRGNIPCLDDDGEEDNETDEKEG